MIDDLKHIIYRTVLEANRKMAPGDVEKAVARSAGVNRKRVRLAIRDLVGTGELRYTYVYGTSFLERSFDRPVRLSKRIVVKPPNTPYRSGPGEVVVDIAGGAAFGNGAHPTTCLALKALDHVFDGDRPVESKAPLNGLDIGTGTGILAIALAKLGVHDVIGIDVDPCAVSEATHNVLLNGLAEQVSIRNTPLEKLASRFSVIVANLAYLTLKRIAPSLSAGTEENGLLILSGFLEPAAENLHKTYAEQGFRLVREETERGWACMTLCKRAPQCS
ncbi:MAG: 50S ribosomal protein L11 methyltransferase [Desulfobacteria bacterium]